MKVPLHLFSNFVDDAINLIHYHLRPITHQRVLK